MPAERRERAAAGNQQGRDGHNPSVVYFTARVSSAFMSTSGSLLLTSRFGLTQVKPWCSLRIYQHFTECVFVVVRSNVHVQYSRNT